MNIEIMMEAIENSDNKSYQIDSGLVVTQDCDIESEDIDKTYDNLKHWLLCVCVLCVYKLNSSLTCRYAQL